MRALPEEEVEPRPQPVRKASKEVRVVVHTHFEADDFTTDETAAEVLEGMLQLPRVTCRYALKECGGDADAAAQWLLAKIEARDREGQSEGAGEWGRKVSRGLGGGRRRTEEVEERERDVRHGYSVPAKAQTTLTNLMVARHDGGIGVSGDESLARSLSGGRRGGFVEDGTLAAGVSVDRIRYLFLVHTKAIRDSAFEKFKRHFGPLGFDRSRFVNVTESLGQGQLSSDAVGAGQFVFCLFQSFDR